MRRKVFDVIRGGSALTVFGGHAVSAFWTRALGETHALILTAGWLAWFAVVAFFVLSGYLITASIMNGFDPLKYSVARLARIYPPLVGAIVLVVGLNLLLPSQGVIVSTDPYAAREALRYTWHDIYMCLTLRSGFSQANGPLWSLYIETRMYMIAALVAVAVLFNGFVRILAICLCAALVYWSVRSLDAFVLYAGLWLLGAALAPVRTGSSRLLDGPYPAWLIFTGGFSYSLYIVHFPILLFISGITRVWVGQSWARIALITILSLIVVPALAYLFALVFEREKFFRAQMLRCLTAMKLRAA